jgi:hypothetical protein
MPDTLASERALVRDLARQLAEAAADPVMETRRKQWAAHNSLRARRPMILVFPEGSWNELLPPESLQCADPALRGVEHMLRIRLYYPEHFSDDTVTESTWTVTKAIRTGSWGIDPDWTPSPVDHGAGAYKPVLHTMADVEKIAIPTVWHDEDETQRQLEFSTDLLGDILDVRLRGIQHISFHMMAQLCHLRGLEQVMTDMCTNPGLLYAAMARLEAGHHAVIERMEAEGWLDLNNDNTYHSSGGNGFTDELPAPGYTGKTRAIDLWASSESQELAQVSPAMHEEFALQYERRLLARFGLNGYGCCEDLTDKLDDVLRIPRIRRISMSPWTNVPRAAERLGGRAIFSWKPHPAHLVGGLDEDALRIYLINAVQAALDNGCFFEMILKDTHTCEGHPERFDRWTRIARETVDKLWPGE